MLNPIAEFRSCPGSIIAVRASRCLGSKLRNAPLKIAERYPAPIETMVVGIRNHRRRCVKRRPDEDKVAVYPFTMKYGRRCLRDDSLPYPLPTDLAEAHRQTLRTLLLCQVFNGPLYSAKLHIEPPTSILEVACGTGFWSETCHRFFSEHGHSSIKFTGVDIAPLATLNENPNSSDINWTFVQHDLRQVPLPFPDNEFSMVMIKDVSMVTPSTDLQQTLMSEYIRILKPGGTIEIWDGDHSLRMLSPNVSSEASPEETEILNLEESYNNPIGTYTVTLKTQLAPPRNPFLAEYNTWIVKALESRKLTATPCTAILPLLLQESSVLEEVHSRRIAIPFGQLWWEREGIGELEAQPKFISGGKRKAIPSAELRKTALTLVVQMIESLEPLLHEVSGKGDTEWEEWMSNMMYDLLKGNGASCGDCLEVRAWWAKKKRAS